MELAFLALWHSSNTICKRGLVKEAREKEAGREKADEGASQIPQALRKSGEADVKMLKHLCSVHVCIMWKF